MSVVAQKLPPVCLEDASLLTVPEVARYLKVSRSMVYLLMERGELPYVKIGRNRRVRSEDVKSLVELNFISREKPAPAGA